MTGFGSASREDAGRQYTLEIRAVNGRYFKAQVRLPEELAGLEAELDSRLSRRLDRGSVTVTVRVDDRSAAAAASVNAEALARYVDEARAAAAASGAELVLDAGSLLTLPGVLVEAAGDERVDRARPILEGLLDAAADALVAMRETEGTRLHEDLSGHLKVMREQIKAVAARSPIVVELFQGRLRQRMETLLAEHGTTVRDEDLLREVAIFAERSDIAEEIARLDGHLDQFDEMLASDGSKPVGRSLDFLAQEMLREANTIGSKCLDTEVGRRIVEIKGAIDRVKEQVQNVE